MIIRHRPWPLHVAEPVLGAVRASRQEDLGELTPKAFHAVMARLQEDKEQEDVTKPFSAGRGVAEECLLITI